MRRQTSTRPAEPAAPPDVQRFLPLTEATIQGLTDRTSFTRGQDYYRAGYLSNTTLRGATLQALSEGQSGGPYRVELTLVPRDGHDTTAGSADSGDDEEYDDYDDYDEDDEYAEDEDEEDADDAVADWNCTCPRGGFCKHVVALALAWVHEPERFVERQGLGALLAGKSREELVALIERMVQRHPELADLVEVPLPTSPREPGQGAQRTVDRASIRRQAASAFSGPDRWGWGAEMGIAAELGKLRQLGDDYAQAGQWANAQVVYTAVVEVATEHYGETHDEGDISAVIAECCAGLVACLDAQRDLAEADRLDPRAREELFEALYELWNFDREYGGIDLAPDVPEAIARNATPDERAAFEARLRERLKAATPAAGAAGDYSSFHSDWTRRAIVGFLLTLKEHAGLSDEEMLEEYRQAALHSDVAATLLRLDRVDEALAVARRHLTQPHDLTTFAQALLAKGGEHVDQAFTLVEERLWEMKGTDGSHEATMLLAWLAQQYAAHGRADKALEIERRRFRAQPGAQTYAAVKAATRLPGLADRSADLWPGLRAEMLAALRDKAAWSELIAIYLSEGEVAEALAALSALEEQARKPAGGLAYQYSYSWGLPTYRIQVAQAAERDFPEQAREIYARAADQLIDQRGRGNYQTAAEYLTRVKRLYERQGRRQEWLDYIAALRERNRSLRALKEELAARGIE